MVDIDRIHVLMNKTQMYSKKVPVDVADEVNKGFTEFLKTECSLEHRLDDVTAAGVIGTLHWYDSKLEIPDKADLKQEDIPVQRNVRILEIRRYDRSAGQDNRMTVIISTNYKEFEKVLTKTADFYDALGYKHHNFGKSGKKPKDMLYGAGRINQDPLHVLMSKTQMYSKNVAVEVADEVSKGFAEFLKKDGGLEQEPDAAVVDCVGAFQEYTSKPEDIPEQRNLRILEIRKYSRETGQDNRIAIIISTNCKELENASSKVASFYSSMGYGQLGNPGSKHSWDKDTKF